MDRIRDWSSLPLELLGEIAERLKVVEDFLAFRGICRSWRKAAPKDNFTGASRAPLLLLGNDDGNDRQLLSFRNNKMLMTVTLPDVDRKKCTEAGFGWLLIQTNTEDVSLLNPVSRVQIQLPSLANFPAYYRDYYGDRVRRAHPPTIQSAVLSSDPSSDHSNFGVMVIVSDMMVCHWKFGDETWTKKEVDNTDVGGLEGAAVFYRGKFYIFRWLTNSSEILAWDPSSMDDFEVMEFEWYDYDCRAYLVVSCGKLLLLFLTRMVDRFIKRVYFEVHHIDVTTGESSRINDLERCAIFVGDNVSISVHASSICSEVIKPNCIYFGQGQNECVRVGVYEYDMARKRAKRVSVDVPVCPPLWLDSPIMSGLEM